MASMGYFDSNRKHNAYSLKWKSVMEMHVIPNFSSIYNYICFFLIDNR